MISATPIRLRQTTMTGLWRCAAAAPVRHPSRLRNQLRKRYYYIVVFDNKRVTDVPKKAQQIKKKYRGILIRYKYSTVFKGLAIDNATKPIVHKLRNDPDIIDIYEVRVQVLYKLSFLNQYHSSRGESRMNFVRATSTLTYSFVLIFASSEQSTEYQHKIWIPQHSFEDTNNS